jgi:hypothetical protein
MRKLEEDQASGIRPLRIGPRTFPEILVLNPHGSTAVTVV